MLTWSGWLLVSPAMVWAHAVLCCAVLNTLCVLLLLLCLFRSDADLQRLVAEHKKAWYKAHPERAGSGVYEARLNSQLGIPLDFDSLSTSMVYAPGDVADRCVQ
jgi:hypothetical protein